METPVLDRFAPDSRYAFERMAVALAISTILGAGMWAIVVVLTAAQRDFGVDRSAASLPYTVLMLGFAFGTMALGRLADRVGIVPPIVVSAVCLCLGFVAAGLAPNAVTFAAAHALIGIGSGAGFGPMMADISHWFVRRRGIAVVVVASGNYLAGTVWPLAMNAVMPSLGWRGTYEAMGLFAIATVLPLSLFLRRRPAAEVYRQSEAETQGARAEVGLSPALLMTLMMLAGFSCCVAMSMPQVHLVAYCGDLGYGVTRGAQMLSLMLFLGVVSRIASGFVADAIGSSATLVFFSFMQAVALVLYTWFDGLVSLFVVSGVFGLFQGGIVPMYAIICRELLPPREAGARIGLVMASTIFGMAFGGYVSGLIFDTTHSYRAAFLNGVAWNVLNLAICGWLMWRRRASGAAPVLA